MKPECPICGWRPLSKTAEERSGKQLRRYFGVIREAWYQWPEKHDKETGELLREFEDSEVFRKWLQMKVGRYERFDTIQLEDRPRDDVVMEISLAVAAAGRHGAFVTTKIFRDDKSARLVVFRSTSIAFPDGRKDGMEHLEFCKLSNDVEALIKSLSGLDPDQLLEEAKRRGHK